MSQAAVKKESLSTLIRKLDDVFSEFIRLRDRKDNGCISCFICGVQIPWRSSQNMHFIDRDQMPTRYDEMNCHAGCAVCNCLDDHHKHKYHNKMHAVYGERAVDELLAKAHGLQKFMRYEIVELIGYYKGKISELRKS